MNRVITLTAALMVLVAGFAVVGQSQAEAGLFNRDKCCKPAKKCRKSRRSRNKCCEATPCCEPAPCCEEAAPACGCQVAAPACGCEAQTACCPSRREQRKARRNCCVQTCGCESSCDAPAGCSSCGGEGCSSCGGAEATAPTPAPEAAPEAPAAPEGDSTT